LLPEGEIILEAGEEVGERVSDGQGRPVARGKVFYLVGEKRVGVSLGTAAPISSKA
jgi:hypothetical protein